MNQENKEEPNQKHAPYTVEDAIKIADEIFKFSREKKYNVGAFVHGLIFALEYSIHTYKVPQKQIAQIKRDCRKYLQQIEDINKE